MGSRQDALAAAAEMVLAVERIASAPGEGGAALVGTVGTIDARPGAINVIPQQVSFTVDVRSGEDVARRRATEAMRDAFEAIARRRRVKVASAVFYELPAAPCDASLQDALAASVARQGLPVRRLPSGAGHDAMVFPPVCPIAMLFVRCGAGGISHHPDETMTAEDAEGHHELPADAVVLACPAAAAAQLVQTVGMHPLADPPQRLGWIHPAAFSAKPRSIMSDGATG